MSEQQLLVLALVAYAWNATANDLLGNFAHVERRRRLLGHRARGGHFESDGLRHVLLLRASTQDSRCVRACEIAGW